MNGDGGGAVLNCPVCKAFTQMQADGRHKADLDLFGVPATYIFGHCIRCGQIGLLLRVQTGSEQFDPDKQLYPTFPRSVDFTLPPLVDESFREALRCESVEAPLATAVMVRRTLEAIAKEFDP